jgi:hypothetical protein
MSEVIREEPVEEESNPFSEANAPVMNFIMTARIYDVLMALLHESNESVAESILKMHNEGHILMPPPWFNGEFIFERMNAPSPDGDEQLNTDE